MAPIISLTEDEVVEILKSYSGKSVIILSHHNADVDSVGSGIVLKKVLEDLNCKVTLGAADSISRLAQLTFPKEAGSVTINPELDADLIVLVDMATPGQLSGFLETFYQSTAKKLIIDHHAVNEFQIKADWIYAQPNVTSTTEIIFAIAKKLGTKLNKNEAAALLLGAIVDTGHLKFAKSQTFLNIAEILDLYNLSYQDALQRLKMPTDASEKIACLKAAQRLKMHKINDFLVVTSNVSSHEAPAARSLIRLGADFAAIAAVRKDENEIRISTRATRRFVEKLDLNLGKTLIPEVAKIIGGSGSGHVSAAGANGKNIDKSEEALEFIVKFIEKQCAGANNEG